MTAAQSKARPQRGLGRVFFYYVALAAASYLLVRFVPAFAEIVSGAALNSGSGMSIFGPGAPDAVGSPVAGSSWSGALLGVISMSGALAIMVPVTWVYMLTHRMRGFDESVVHTLLILPVAVTGIVMIVHNNLALAFSLAGIVAAVRFRTTLDDTKDAVYVFLAIGVGLSSGVQALGLALVLSIMFNGVVLVLWKTQFGNVYADPNTRNGPVALGDVLAGPASAQTALRVGDPAILDAAAPSDLAEIAERAVRIEQVLQAERARKKEKRATSLILAHGSAGEAVQTFVEEALTATATRFVLIQIAPQGDGVLVEYLARLEGAGAEGALVDRLNGAPDVVRAAEVRSLRGLKKFS